MARINQVQTLSTLLKIAIVLFFLTVGYQNIKTFKENEAFKSDLKRLKQENDSLYLNIDKVSKNNVKLRENLKRLDSFLIISSKQVEKSEKTIEKLKNKYNETINANITTSDKCDSIRTMLIR